MPNDATWIEFFRSPDDGKAIVALMKGPDVVKVAKPSGREEIIRMLQNSPGANNVMVAPPGKPVPTWNNAPGKLEGKKIVLDPGHSEMKVGARGPDGIEEEDLNRLQAQVVAEKLSALGAIVEIYDTDYDDLWSIGQKANGSDLFMSLHHNAYDGKPHYVCCMVDSRVGSGKSKKFASMVAKAISSEIKEPLFEADLPGVYPARLSVLRSAEGASPKGPCVLVESYFCDDRGLTKATAEEKTKKAGEAIVKAVEAWFA